MRAILGITVFLIAGCANQTTNVTTQATEFTAKLGTFKAMEHFTHSYCPCCHCISCVAPDLTAETSRLCMGFSGNRCSHQYI